MSKCVRCDYDRIMDRRSQYRFCRECTYDIAIKSGIITHGKVAVTQKNIDSKKEELIIRDKHTISFFGILAIIITIILLSIIIALTSNILRIFLCFLVLIVISFLYCFLIYCIKITTKNEMEEIDKTLKGKLTEEYNKKEKEKNNRYLDEIFNVIGYLRYKGYYDLKELNDDELKDILTYCADVRLAKQVDFSEEKLKTYANDVKFVRKLNPKYNKLKKVFEKEFEIYKK